MPVDPGASTLLFVNSVFPVASQTFVLDQIHYARKSGFRVVVLCKKFNTELAQELRHDIDLFAISVYDRPRTIPHVLMLLFRALCRPRLVLRYLRHRRSGRIHFSDLVCVLQLQKAPDVIIANFGVNGVVAARLKRAFFPMARTAVIFHGYDLSSVIRKRGWVDYRRMEHLIDVAVCVNKQWAALLEENTGIPNIVVNHLGVDVDTTCSRDGDTKRFAVLFVGRLTEKKGANYLIEAVGKLVARGYPIRLDVIGEGDESDALTGLAAAQGLGRSVVFHGRKSHDFVLRMMSTSDCLAAPSVTAADGDMEGIPVVLMEAMASGLPVVSTFHSGIPELIEDGETGLLVPERDADALAGAIERLILDRDLRKRLAAAGRAFVEKEFNASLQTRRLFDIVVGRPEPVTTRVRNDAPAPVDAVERCA